MRHTVVPFIALAAALQVASIISSCSCPSGSGERMMELVGVTADLYDNSGSSPVHPTAGSIPARALAISVVPGWADVHHTDLLRMLRPSVAVANEPCPDLPFIAHHLDTVASAEVIRVGEGAERQVGGDFVAIEMSGDAISMVGSIREFNSLPAMINYSPDELSLYSPFREFFLLLREELDAMKGDDVRFIVRLNLTDGRTVADTTDAVAIR